MSRWQLREGGGGYSRVLRDRFAAPRLDGLTCWGPSEAMHIPGTFPLRRYGGLEGFHSGTGKGWRVSLQTYRGLVGFLGGIIEGWRGFFQTVHKARWFPCMSLTMMGACLLSGIWGRWMFPWKSCKGMEGLRLGIREGWRFPSEVFKGDAWGEGFPVKALQRDRGFPCTQIKSLEGIFSSIRKGWRISA